MRATREDLPLDFLGWNISLCSEDRKDPFPYKHFYLVLRKPSASGSGTVLSSKGWILEFSLNPESNEGEVSIGQVFKSDMGVTVSNKTVTEEELDRIVSVLYAKNFSYCLRNSENFAKFIYNGSWRSDQLTQNKDMRKIFDQIFTREDRKKLNICPTDVAARMSRMQEPMFQDLTTGMIQFTRKQSLKGCELPQNAYNIIVVGPTGAGKSTLINLLFNSTVCDVRNDKENFAAVTREACVVTGVHNCDDGDIPVNIIDTMGLCDTFLEDEEAITNLFEDFINEHSKIDKVVFVTCGFISPEQEKGLSSILDRFQYPRQLTDMDSKKKRNNFIFLYNKTETMNDAIKLRALQNMGKKLGVDIGHKVPVMTLAPGEEDSGMMAEHKVNAGMATSTNCDGEFDAATQKTFKKLKAALLPHTVEILQSPDRLQIAEMQC